MRTIPINKIDYDPHYYCRVTGKPDWMTILRYKEVVESYPWKANTQRKGAFPPIVVVAIPKGRFLVLDGVHRLKAFHAAGLKVVSAAVEKLPKSKWFARSTELNVPHARGLDNGDRAWIAKRLEQDGYEKAQVASLLNVSTERLEKIVIGCVHKLTNKEATAIKEGRANRKVDGRRYGFLKAPLADLTNTSRGKTALQHQAPLSARTVAQVLDAAIAVFQSGAVDLDDEEIADKVGTLKGILDGLAVVSK